MSKQNAASSIALLFSGLIESLRPEQVVIEDHDPGDEQPEPDYTALINAAIDRRRATMTPAPVGAGDGQT